MDNNKIDKNLWTKVVKDSSEAEKVVRPSLTYAQDAWRRLKKNIPAIVGLFVIIFIVLVAVFLPSFYGFSFSDQNLEFTNVPPRFEIYQVDESNYIFISAEFKSLNVSKEGELLEASEMVREDRTNRINEYLVNGHVVKVDYSVALQKTLDLKILDKAAKNDPTLDTSAERKEINDRPNFNVINDDEIILPYDKVSNKTYIWGSDTLGRDLFIRVIYGARISLTIGFVAALVNFVIGVIYGGISGYLGGRVDEIMMRIVDVISTVPMMLYVILLMVVLKPGLTTIIIALSLTFWVRMARIVRGQILQLKEQEYVLAAVSLGAALPRIMFRHLIPNAMGPIMVALTMQIPSAIFTEAFLSFIGLGVSAPQASWGTLCNDALSGLYTYPYQLFFPAFAISITLISFNLLGDGLRDALDPKLRK